MITIILIILMAILDSTMDMNFNQYSSSIFSNTKVFNPQFWNPSVSWANKWKNGIHGDGEKFLGSSTVFVFLTDSWHLFKMLFLSLTFIALLTAPISGVFKIFDYILLNYLFNYFIYALIWGVFFQITESLLTKKA